MRNRSKLLLVALATAAVLAVAVDGAFAGHFRVNEQGFRIRWAALRFSGGGTSIICPVTLEGSFHSATINKTPNALIGYVSRAILTSANCTERHATILQETLPWHVTYESFTGTLPDIRTINVQLSRASFRLEVPLIGACLAVANGITGTIETEVAEGESKKPDNVIPDSTRSISCAGINGNFSGTGRVTKLSAAERILLRLI